METSPARWFWHVVHLVAILSLRGKKKRSLTKAVRSLAVAAVKEASLRGGGAAEGMEFRSQNGYSTRDFHDSP